MAHRERLEKAIDDMLDTRTCLDVFDRAIAEERERCAKAVETAALLYGNDEWREKLALLGVVDLIRNPKEAA